MNLSSNLIRARTTLIAVLVVLAAPVASRGAPEPEVSPPIFASGRQNGNYHAVAVALAAETARRGLAIHVEATGGSFDNAELLRKGEADIALIQSDVAYLEHYNRRPFLALASVYTEPIHIVAYRGLELHRLSEILTLDRKIVAAVGAPGSGTSAHALAILDELDWPEGHVETLQLSIDEAAEGLRNRDVDIAFLTSAVPAKAIKKLAADRIISLLAVDRDIAQRLRRRNPFFVAAEIPYAAYGASRSNVQTLGTRSLLVARPDLSRERVEILLDALYAVASRADDSGLPFLRNLSIPTALSQLSIPAHAAASRYHETRIDKSLRWLNFLRHNMPVLILLGAAILVLSQLSRFSYFVHQFVLGRVLLALISVWFLGSVAMHLFEGSKNSAFRTFSSSAVAILHYLFSGLESKYPVTPAGNAVAVLVLSFGVGVVTLFTATLVTLLIEQALNIKTLRSKPFPFLKLAGHVVILGWSGRTRRIIRQLRSRDLRRRPKIVVVAEKASETRVEDRSKFRGVWVVEGDRAQAKTLRQADIGYAASAIVLPRESADHDADASSVSSTLAIEKLAPIVHTIVEARSPGDVEHLAYSQADEVVDTNSLAERLLSQCVITPGLADIFSELLTFGRDSQEIYVLPLTKNLDGRCLLEIQERMKTYDLIVVGYWRNGDSLPRINPDARSARLRLKATSQSRDRLIILADSLKALPSASALWWQGRKQMKKSPQAEVASGSSRSDRAPEVVTKSRGGVRRIVHVGLCGWNSAARSVVAHLQGSLAAAHQEFKITVISGPVSSSSLEECTRDVRFVFGDPTRRAVLENAGVGEMDALVILADRSNAASEEFSDHRALMISLAAREVSSQVHLVAEVLRSKNQEHFERLPDVEVVSVEDLTEKLLAQAVISPGITKIFTELLTTTEDSNEIYIVPVPDFWQGQPFSKAAQEVQASEVPVIALGYRCRAADGSLSVILNPRQKKSKIRGAVSWRQRVLAEGDALVVMAYEEPVW